jgi:hypothetical protein
MEDFNSREISDEEIPSLELMPALDSLSITTNVEDKSRLWASLLRGISDRSDEINLQYPYPNELT